MQFQRGQRGATLLEVLVSMVILTVALLGMAGLTSSAIKSNQSSRMRAIGLSLVNDYTERARSNTVGFSDYAYVVGYNASTRSAATSDPTTAPSSCDVTVDLVNPANSTNTCAAAIATYDQSQWLTNVANRLPGGTAYIVTETPDASSAVAGMPPTRVLNIWLIWSAIAEADGFAQTQTCPSGASIPTDGSVSVNCMYFRVTL